MLGTLEGIGAVARDDDDRTYRIGMGLVELAGAVDASAALATLVRPHLTDLADRTGEAAGFSVPTGYTMHYLVQAESPNAVQVRDYSGLTVPMHVGPSGLCVMSLWPDVDVDRYLKRPLESFTRHTVSDPKMIRKRLESIRKRGHCWIHEEFAEGISSVAAPVFDQCPAGPGSDPRPRPDLSFSRDRRSRCHRPARDGCRRTRQHPRRRLPPPGLPGPRAAGLRRQNRSKEERP